eukprot:9230546-Pyramimonas_sp.AAC.1
MDARSPSLSCRFPGCSRGAGAPWRRAEMLPLSLALQWGASNWHRPPSLPEELRLALPPLF